LIVEGC